jgi:hypothetical protein
MMEIQDGAMGEWHFLCGDLERNGEFKTTSFTAYSRDYMLKAKKRGFWEDKKWPLPYRSLLCSAIGQAPTQLVKIPGGNPSVAGFLSVDSESRHAFTGQWDVQIIYGLADALFHPLARYIKTFKKAVKSNPYTGGA